MITGHTKLLVIIADPVTQVRTPQAMNAMLADMGKDAVLGPAEVSSEGLPKAVEGLRCVTRSLSGLSLRAP